MSTGTMTSDWYYCRRGAPAGQQVGPLTWEQLYSQAQSGQFGPDDLVWNPQLPDWLPAAQIPGLVPAAYPGAYQPAARPKSGGRSHLLAWLIPMIAMIIVGGGLGAYFGLIRDRDGDNGGSTAGNHTNSTAATVVVDMGKAECTVPDPAKLVEADGLGEVPANRISVVLADGQSSSVAKDLAKALGGSVVGEIEFMNAYQIETDGSTEADLTAALATASATPGVELAFPDLQASFFVEIWGVRQSPLNDPAYANGKDGAFQLIGAPKAWTYMRGAGLPLSEVHVGVVDNGLYRGTNEYDGDVNVYFPDSNAGEITDPDNPTGSHGTMVAGQLGADANNGGNTGVASPVLGNLLTVSMVNNADGAYGDTPVASPDPEDPTVIQYSNGRSYSFGSLVAITKEIETGARVINCSWGFDAKYLNELYKKEQNGEVAQGTYAQQYQNAKDQAAAYKKFFEKMSTAHPEVLFVCAAGNTGNPGNGPFEWPAGFALPNMVSVGNVNNNGTTAQSSSKVNTNPGEEFEVTLAAAGQETVQGVDKDGNPIVAGYTNGEYTNYGGGTSAASPQVAAAAALLLALDPELSAAEIKQILSDTARPGPAEVGGKILAVDQAVLQVINQQRDSMGLPAVTGEELEKGGVIDAVATSQDEEGQNVWSVKAIIDSLPSAEGAEITITATTGTKIEGQTTQKITVPGDIVWAPVKIPNETAQITITRSDSGASTIISFEPIDLNGYWEGSFTFGSFDIDQSAVSSGGAGSSGGGAMEGCDLSVIGEVLAKMQNRPFPMTMDMTVDAEGNGTAVTVIDMSSFAAELAAEYPEGEVSTSGNEPQTFNFTFSGNTLTFQLDESSGAGGSMRGVVRKQGEDLVIDGTLSSSGTGFSMVATWTVTQQ
jgi:hypothetical protein